MRVITIIPVIIISLLVFLFIHRLPDTSAPIEEAREEAAPEVKEAKIAEVVKATEVAAAPEEEVTEAAIEPVKEEAAPVRIVKSASPMEGKPLPKFTLPSLWENHLGLSTMDIKGKKALVNIFASWCAPCLEEHKHLKTLSEKGLPIFGIAWRDDKKKLDEWLKRHGNPYQKIGFATGGDTLVDFGITGVPESFLVDENMKILVHHRGPITPDIISDIFAPHIE